MFVHSPSARHEADGDRSDRQRANPASLILHPTLSSSRFWSRIKDALQKVAEFADIEFAVLEPIIEMDDNDARHRRHDNVLSAVPRAENAPGPTCVRN